jgi:hypothetical protein
MIYGASLSREERKQYQFPKFVSQFFIDNVENIQKSGKPFTHKIYEKNGKELILKYEIIENTKQSSRPIESINDMVISKSEVVAESILGNYSISDFGLYELLLVVLGK